MDRVVGDGDGFAHYPDPSYSFTVLLHDLPECMVPMRCIVPSSSHLEECQKDGAQGSPSVD